MRASFALAALGALGIAGCTTSVRRGADLYAEQRYVEAAEVFEHTEARAAAATPREQAEYAAFRGLTLLQLGDRERARLWLARAWEVERAHPGALREDHRSLVERGWAALVAGPPSGTVAASTASTLPAGQRPPSATRTLVP